jgi:hypothetical protein
MWFRQPASSFVAGALGARPAGQARRRGQGWRWALSLSSWLCLGLAGCGPAAKLTGSEYRRGAVAYRLGPLSRDWQRVRSGGADLAFRHGGGGTIVVSGQCPAQDDAPLDVLTNHLLFGVTARKEQARQTLTLDGREALRTQLAGALDGVTVALDLVVLKKDGCLYDLQLIAGPTVFPDRQPDFSAFVSGFATSPRR